MKNAMSRRFSLAVVLGLLALVAPGRAEAAFATYIESGVGFGTLGGRFFSNSLVTLTQTADTNNVITNPLGTTFSVAAVTSTVSLEGFALASFTVPTFVYSTINGPSGGLGEGGPVFGGAIIFTMVNAGFASYDLRGSIGPILGGAILNQNTPFATTSGNFVLSGLTNASFQAIVTSAVPEPSSLALCGVAGSIGLCVARIRRERPVRPTTNPAP